MAKRLLPPDWHVTKDNGDPATDATLAFRVAGSSTPTPIWYDKELTLPTTAGTSSVSCDATGYPASGGNDVAIWGADTVSYDCVVTATGYNGGASKTLEDLAVADDTTTDETDSHLALGNAFDNGGFEAWSNGTTFSNVSGDGDGDVTADGWYVSQSTLAGNAVSRQNAISSARYSMRIGRPDGSSNLNDIRLWATVKPEIAHRLRGKEVALRYTVRAGTGFSPSTGDGNYINVKLCTGTTESEDGDLINSGGFAGNVNVISQTVLIAKSAQRFEHIVTLANNIKEVGVQFLLAGFVGTASSDYIEIGDVDLKLTTDNEEFEGRPEALEFLLSNLSTGGRLFAKSSFADPGADRVMIWDDSASDFAGVTLSNETPFTNTTDNASVQVAIFEGDRATPANSDAAYVSYRMSNGSGSQIEIARQQFTITNVTAGAERGILSWSTMNAGALATRLTLNETFLGPSTNDGLALGGLSNAYSDAFFANGAVLNFNNDIMLTHSTDALNMTGGQFLVSQAVAASTVSARFVNSVDNASVATLRLEGDRATPTAGDAIYTDWVISDSAGNQDVFSRMLAVAAVVTSGSVLGWFRWSGMTAGVLTSRLEMTTNQLRPTVNDAMALGGATLSYSDVFVANGAVYNANNGNATITHVTGGFEVGGTWRSRTSLSSETSGTLTSASANRRVKATAGVTINDGVFTAEDAIEIYNDSDVSITITQDTGMTLRLAGTTSTGNRTLAARGVAYVYFDTNADAAVAGSGVS